MSVDYALRIGEIKKNLAIFFVHKYYLYDNNFSNGGELSVYDDGWYGVDVDPVPSSREPITLWVVPDSKYQRLTVLYDRQGEHLRIKVMDENNDSSKLVHVTINMVYTPETWEDRARRTW